MNRKRIVIRTIAIILLAILIICMPWLILLLGGIISSNPAFPEITRGEFPICLEYEIGDKYVKVEDVLVCEFDGFGFNEGNGKFRKWKATLESGNTRITLFKDDIIEIYYFPIKDDSRLPGIFMGDTEFYTGGIGNTFPDAWYTTHFEDKTVNDYIICADEMKIKYNIQLIRWECASPIENNFK